MLAAMPLTLADLPADGSAAKPANTLSVVERLRDSHHGVARLLARGLKVAEISGITGYTPGHISRLQQDPAFAELVEHYREVGQVQYASVTERLEQIALDTLQELQHKMQSDPSVFTPAALTELAKVALDRSGYGPTKNINSQTTTMVLKPEDYERIKDRAQQNGQVRRLGYAPSQTKEDIIDASPQPERESAVQIPAPAAPAQPASNPTPPATGGDQVGAAAERKA